MRPRMIRRLENSVLDVSLREKAAHRRARGTAPDDDHVVQWRIHFSVACSERGSCCILPARSSKIIDVSNNVSDNTLTLCSSFDNVVMSG